MSQEISPSDNPADAEYGADQILALKGLEGIRMRPAMYIGETDTRGLHHLVFEVVDNSIDEFVAGHGTLISVLLRSDGSITCSDDGRGIPVDPMPDEDNLPAVEVVLTKLHAGGKFSRQGGYRRGTGGLHGVGIKAVNALSEWLDVEVRRGGHVYRMELARGHVTSKLSRLGTASSTGTTFTFRPDPEIFPDVRFNFDTLHRRLQELAFLNSGVRIRLEDERTGQKDEFYYEGGLTEFVRYLNRTENTLFSDVISIRGKETVPEKPGEVIELDISLQYNDGYNENCRCFANNISNPDGGTHLSGFRGGLTRALNNYGKKYSLNKDFEPNGDDFREGLTAVITVNVSHPQFQSQNKTKLLNVEVEGIVGGVTYDILTRYFEEHPAVVKKIYQKALTAAEAREAARKSREMVRRKGALTSGGLPEKLRDCRTHELAISELFLVEGQSAGGSADTGRDSNTQAILPLRGKILNVEKAQLIKVLDNEEIAAIFKAIGVQLGGEMEDASKRRYGKVILMTDADVDGSHIRTLLLTFFFRHMRPLIEHGCIYIAQPPLFKVTKGKHTRYVQTLEAMNSELLALGLKSATLRFATGHVFNEEQLTIVTGVIDSLEEHLEMLERRGIDLRLLANNHLTETGLIPRYRTFLGREQFWFVDKMRLDEFVTATEQRLGRPIVVSDDRPVARSSVSQISAESEESQQGKAAAGSPTASEVPSELVLQVVDLHEVRSVNPLLEKLRGYGISLRDLVPAGTKDGATVYPFAIVSDGDDVMLTSLRDLVPKVRKQGEKGLKVTRFKGLGEMDADELGVTAMDPKSRALLKVGMADALAADEIFRVLMGDHVEPRREFIERHALDVKDLDV